MNIREECLKVQALGYPIAAIAKRIKCDPSTLSKWLKGKLNISENLQALVYEDLRKLKEKWMQIEI